MTTPRKWRAPTPEELDRGSELFDFDLPDGGRVVVRGEKEARAFARKMLPDVLATWERIWTYGTEDGTQAVVRGTFPAEREIVKRFNLPALERDLSAEHFALVKALHEALREQSVVASYAAHLARVELGTAAKRTGGGGTAAAALKREAVAREANLQAEARKIRKLHPSWPVSEIARSLSERQDLGGFHSIYRKLLRLLRDKRK